MQTDFFAPHRQFRRALALDWRLHRTDLLWSSVYVLIGFIFRDRTAPSTTPYLILPFILAGLATDYLAFRLCALEFRRPYRDLLRALPHDPEPTWRAHLAILMATALALDLLIALAMLLRLNAPPGVRYHVLPVIFLFPFFATTVVMLFFYTEGSATGPGLTMLGVTLVIILSMLGAPWIAVAAGGAMIAAVLRVTLRELLKPGKEALR